MKSDLERWRRMARVLVARGDRAKTGLALARRRLSDHQSAGHEMAAAAARLEPLGGLLDGVMLAHILDHRRQSSAKEGEVNACLAQAHAALSLQRLARRRALEVEVLEDLRSRRHELSELIANSGVASPPQASGSKTRGPIGR